MAFQTAVWHASNPNKSLTSLILFKGLMNLCICFADFSCFFFFWLWQKGRSHHEAELGSRPTAVIDQIFSNQFVHAAGMCMKRLCARERQNTQGNRLLHVFRWKKWSQKHVTAVFVSTKEANKHMHVKKKNVWEYFYTIKVCFGHCYPWQTALHMCIM